MTWFTFPSFLTFVVLLQVLCTSSSVYAAGERRQMVPGIHIPSSKVSALSGLLSPRGVIRRQFTQCEDPTATLCAGGGFCCAAGSFCQPFNREFDGDCCPDNAFNCNDGQSCCPPNSFCCSFSESSTGCCSEGSAPPPPPPPPPPTTHKTTKSTPRPETTRTPTTTQHPATPTTTTSDSGDDDSGDNDSGDNDSGNTETDVDFSTFGVTPSINTPQFSPINTFQAGTGNGNSGGIPTPNFFSNPGLSPPTPSLPSQARGQDAGANVLVSALSVVVVVVFF
ncbi:hypothetical protein CPC08DRAFT_751095 [Agrocybe pediades]|nr:hypothetical protein CPC08DRAFT_717462 [Agrocybe pediades]KAF9559077.1 hypothetical protein CPC08DRAFT_751095 [Agrocybe pediades]